MLSHRHRLIIPFLTAFPVARMLSQRFVGFSLIEELWFVHLSVVSQHVEPWCGAGYGIHRIPGHAEEKARPNLAAARVPGKVRGNSVGEKP